MSTIERGDGEEPSAEGYRKGLGNRQVQMIAIGGTIGVGLFLGAGEKLHKIGPSLLLSYLVCGIAAFFVMRALGELIMHRATSGSFVTYSREFIGPWAGFVSGWMYWVNWAATGVAELTAIGVYMHKWLPDLPQWVTALVALLIVLVVNLISVKLFGELEFWFSVIKVFAIVAFLLTGLYLVIFGVHIGASTAGPHLLFTGSLFGSFFPAGFGIALMSLQSVIFAYNGIELVGVAAGETKNPSKIIPKAINSVAWRIALFYCGSVLLLVMILPWTAYSGGGSPFVQVFSGIGIPAAGHIMNLVVITAAFSSVNSGLYSTGRVLRSLAERKEAPRFAGKMSRRQVPAGGIALTAIVYVLGVVLNVFLPKDAFDIATTVAGLGVIVIWVAFLVAQLRLRAMAQRGELTRPGFRMPGAPYTNYLTLAFLALVVVLLGFSDDISGKIAFYSIPVLVVILGGGWLAVRGRSAEAVRESAGVIDG